MRSLTAIALGLLFVGIGIFAAAAVTPAAFPSAFSAEGATTNAVALVVMLAITEVFAMFGGWVTSRLVDDHRLGHAVMMSICGLAVAVFVGAVRWSAAPAWYYVASWGLIPCAGALGAAAWERSMRRRKGGVAHRAATT
jgi:MFS-type transporter involved in bile tolerance (Atg22 family)